MARVPASSPLSMGTSLIVSVWAMFLFNFKKPMTHREREGKPLIGPVEGHLLFLKRNGKSSQNDDGIAGHDRLN